MKDNKPIRVAVLASPLLLLAALILYLATLDFNTLKPAIVQQVEETTGRKLTISGDIELQLSTAPQLSVTGVRLSNANWGSRQNMVTIDKVVAKVELWSLLGGNLEILKVIVEGGDILLEKGATGAGNWMMGQQAEQTDARRAPEEVELPLIHELQIMDLQLTYIDGVSERIEQVTISRLSATSGALTAPFKLQTQGRYHEQPFQLDLLLDNLAAITATEQALLNLSVQFGERSGKLTGALLVDTAAGRYHLSEIDLQLAESRLQGELSIDQSGDRPDILANLSSPQINVSALAALLSHGGEKEKKQGDIQADDEKKEADGTVKRLFPQTPLDLQGMSAIDAKIDFTAERVVTDPLLVTDLQTQLNVSDATLTIEPLQFVLGRRPLNGRLSVGGAESTSFTFNLQGSGIPLGEAMRDEEEHRQIEGAVTDIDINLSAEGDSVAAIMGDLNGKVLLQVGEGKINNQYLNLAGGDILSQLGGALNPVAKTDELTLLECAVVNLRIENGQCEFDKNIAIETDKMVIVGSGKVDLDQETLSIHMKPSPRQDSVDLGIGAGDLVSAARLEGTLLEPVLGLDPLGSAKTGVKIYQAIATGGTSLILGGLIDKALSDPHPCKTALEE